MMSLPALMLADLIRTSWNTLIPYMEQIAALMQEKLNVADLLRAGGRATLSIPATF
jgi:hypothetical protein